MGSTLKTKDLDKEKKSIIINTLSKVKQKVILKWDDDTQNLKLDPKKFFVSNWLPQNDILAHQNIKVYITHGGLLSTTEAIHHGIPVVGIPIFGDQQMNIERYKQFGFAVQVDFSTISEETLGNAINEVLDNPKYSINVKKLSKRFRDRPMSPLQTAKFWIEYVIRHGNADFLHSPAKKLNWIQYFNLDVYFLLGCFDVICLYVFLKVTKFVFKKLYTLFSQRKNKEKKS